MIAVREGELGRHTLAPGLAVVASQDSAKLIRRKPLKHDRLGAFRPPGQQHRRTSLTICIAALADQGRAIVCVADKMLSFGEYLQWDSDITKIVHINGTKCIALMAGSISHCEAVLNSLAEDPTFGNDIDDTVGKLRDSYEKIFTYFQDTEVLHRRGLTKETYHQSLLSTQVPRVVERLYEEMEQFSREKWDCDLMVCGFDKRSNAFIMSAVSPGIVQVQTAQGYHSIGIASDIASARLLFSRYKRDHRIGRVLFDVFDAKVNAEMSTGVGFSWDAHVVFPDGIGVVPEKPIKELLERAWDHHNISPFAKWNKIENMPKPGARWKERILDISREGLTLQKFSLGNETGDSINTP